MWEWPRDKLTCTRSSYLPPAPPLPAKHSITCQRETHLFVCPWSWDYSCASLTHPAGGVCLSCWAFPSVHLQEENISNDFPLPLRTELSSAQGTQWQSSSFWSQSFILIFFKSRSLFTNFPAHCAIWVISAPSRFSVDCVPVQGMESWTSFLGDSFWGCLCQLVLSFLLLRSSHDIALLKTNIETSQGLFLS